MSIADLLEMNRAGLLDPHQADPILARFRLQQRIALWVFCLCLGLPVVLMIYFAISLPATHPAGSIWEGIMPLIMIGLICWLIYSFSLQRPLKAVKADIAAGKVGCAEGRVTYQRAFYDNDYFYLALDGVRLMGNKVTYLPLAKSGKRLQAFYLPRSRILVMLTVIGE